MQLKQVADLAGVDKKDIIEALEARRDQYTAQGFKIPKKPNAASALADELAALILASFDERRLKDQEAEREADDRRKREEEERRRAAEEIERKRKEEELRAQQEERRLKADAELARKRAEVARVEAAKPPVAVPAPQPEQQPVPVQAEKPAPQAVPPTPPTPAQVPVAEVIPLPAQISQPAPAPPAPVPQQPVAQQPAAQAEAFVPPAPPRTFPTGPQQRDSRDSREFQRPGGQFPAGRDDRGGERRPDQRGGMPPRRDDRTGPPRRDDQRTGPPRRDDQRTGPPRSGDRPGGPRRDDQRGGPPRTGDRPGGPRRDDRTGGPRRDQPQGRGRGERPAQAAGIQDFINTGMEAKVEDDYRRTRRTRPTKPVAGPAKAPEGDFEGAKGAKRKPAAQTDGGRKKIRPSQIFNPSETVTGRTGGKPRKKGQQQGGGQQRNQPQAQQPRVIRLYGDFTVGDFAEQAGLPASDVIKRLFLMGEMLTINHLLAPEKAEELALELELEIEIERESDEADVASYVVDEDAPEDLVPRAPVVTIMGHVDHGKTTLLDRIRKADVAAHEFGGITQHIGAYLVQTPKGDVVFLDTPGHEAFTEMRSRGANVTDLVVLVVAANDGVMPQTVEAISHAKAAHVPILVAINKIDVVGANPERIKQELMKYEMVPEEYGGDTIMLPVSAISGDGIDGLLEYVALQTEIMELKANPNRPAEGAVVESHIDPTRGAVATVLVQRGTLRVGDIFVCGTEWGRVRAMRDDRNKEIEVAGPSTPVEVLGLRGSPDAGEKFIVMPSEPEAREIAERREQRRRKRAQSLKPHISLDNLAEHMREDEAITLNIVLKADVQGSVEAIANALHKIKSDRVIIRILHSAVGAINSSDIHLAEASDAIVIGFNVTTESNARYLAEETGVDIRHYQIIYHLLEDIEKAMLGMLAPEFEEKEESRCRVKETFRVSKIGTAAGCFVEEGTVAMGQSARLIRNGAVVWRGKLKSLRRVKDEVKQVLSGVECGITLENFNDVKEGDIIETFSLVERQVSLISSEGTRKPETSRT